MRSLRRLSVVSVASLSAILLLCSAGVRAQTAGMLSTPPVLSPNPAPFAIPTLPSLSAGQSSPTQPIPFTAFRLPPLSLDAIHNLKTLDTQKPGLLARNNGPCYALRSYGFTTGRDFSSAPRLSSYTTCTPAAETHLKEIVKTPSSP